MHYKAPDNSLHFIDPEFEYLLPAGSVEITDEEAEALRPQPPPLTPLDQIAAIESANPITHRMLRDLSMTVAQIAAAVTGTDMMTNPAVREIALVQTTIDALREQARTDGLIP